MTNFHRLAALAVALLGFRGVAAAPTEQSEVANSLPGLTYEEFLEALTLNSTDNWEPMSRVPIVHFTEGETLDLGHGLNKRGGGNRFTAWRSGSCTGTKAFVAENFGCGVCVTTGESTANRIFGAGTLWREKTGGKYPTANWYSGVDCGGAMLHKQGILSGHLDSCDTASGYGLGVLPQSVMLYQGC
ncbi:hypothetical protein GE09DRAFT_1064782 [Coniochaeta sp. 2T2.1]|nr:hypothetical protein GE09DRAFT_1064782 [Coniochaeta sp. 2T2.1]